jgi:hypothetical protein
VRAAMPALEAERVVRAGDDEVAGVQPEGQ